jgi:anti-anti-sigma factor
MHTLVVHADPRRDRSVVAGWIAGAVSRGEKVLYKHAPTEDAVAVLGRSLPAVGLESAVLSSGQVALVDAAVLRAECGGLHARLYELHREQVRQATREGFSGLAITGDGAVMRIVTRDEAELRAYERDIDLLAVESGLRSLCRYDTQEPPEFLDEILGLHYRDIEDNIWAGTVAGDRLSLRGEIDISNADRFAAVLHAAVADGLHKIDLSGLQFCAIAGIRAIASATDLSHRDGERLELVNVDPGLARLLTISGVVDHPGLQLSEQGTDA